MNNNHTILFPEGTQVYVTRTTDGKIRVNTTNPPITEEVDPNANHGTETTKN